MTLEPVAAAVEEAPSIPPILRRKAEGAPLGPGSQRV